METLIRIALALQCLGLGLVSWRWGSPVDSYLFMVADFSDQFSTRVDQLMGGLLIVGGILLLKSWYIWPLFLLATWALLSAVIDSFMGGKFFREISILTQTTRYLAPWVFVFLLSYKISFNGKALQVLQWAIACTFIFHGVEALYLHPTFIDYLITASQRFLPLRLMQSQAEWLLLGIGLVDILLGLCLLITPSRPVCFYMAFWGLITALARIVYSPNLAGIEQTLLRSGHWAVPLLIGLEFKKYPLQTSLRELFTLQTFWGLRRLGISSNGHNGEEGK